MKLRLVARLGSVGTTVSPVHFQISLSGSWDSLVHAKNAMDVLSPAVPLQPLGDNPDFAPALGDAIV
jgi:hypothetical protein